MTVAAAIAICFAFNRLMIFLRCSFGFRVKSSQHLLATFSIEIDQAQFDYLRWEILIRHSDGNPYGFLKEFMH
jgi:hypothetical protein